MNDRHGGWYRPRARYVVVLVCLIVLVLALSTWW
jgi:hypothetical protein